MRLSFPKIWRCCLKITPTRHLKCSFVLLEGAPFVLKQISFTSYFSPELRRNRLRYWTSQTFMVYLIKAQSSSVCLETNKVSFKGFAFIYKKTFLTYLMLILDVKALPVSKKFLFPTNVVLSFFEGPGLSEICSDYRKLHKSQIQSIKKCGCIIFMRSVLNKLGWPARTTNQVSNILFYTLCASLSAKHSTYKKLHHQIVCRVMQYADYWINIPNTRWDI